MDFISLFQSISHRQGLNSVVCNGLLLPSLLDLPLTTGVEGYDALDLSGLRALTSLIIDNCEYVQLDQVHLPPKLVKLTIRCWYGLKELYILSENDKSIEVAGAPSPGGSKITYLEEKSKVSKD